MPHPTLQRRTTDKEGAACYICFDSHSDVSGPLIESPCTCASPVHAQCLHKWIVSKGSRTCSICRSKLPIQFAAHPPYLVLQVVRHMRGLHWTGEREYVVGFGSVPFGGVHTAAEILSLPDVETPVHQWHPGYVENVVIGSGRECHLQLPDPSLSRRHSCLSYDGAEFRIEDLHSSAGTYVRATAPVTIRGQRNEQFKIGRTTLTIDVLSDAPLMAPAGRGGSRDTLRHVSAYPGVWGRGSRRSTQVSPTHTRGLLPSSPTLRQSASSVTAGSGGASAATGAFTLAGAAGQQVRDTHSDASSFVTLGRSVGSQPSYVTYQGSTMTGTGNTQVDGRSITVAHSSSLAYVTEH